MEVEQGVGRELRDQLVEMLPRKITLAESRPQRRDPRAAPAGVTAPMSKAALERGPRGSQELWRGSDGRVMPRENAVEVRQVSMRRFWLIPVVHILLELPVLSNLERRKVVPHRAPALLEVFVNAKDVAGLQAVVQHLACQQQVHCRANPVPKLCAIPLVRVLGRVGRHGDESAG